MVGGIAEAVLLLWLVQMAWTDAVDEPALSVGDGLVAIAFFGGAASLLIVSAGFAYTNGKPRAATVERSAAAGRVVLEGAHQGLERDGPVHRRGPHVERSVVVEDVPDARGQRQRRERAGR